jgi:hypothetical protein
MLTPGEEEEEGFSLCTIFKATETVSGSGWVFLFFSWATSWAAAGLVGPIGKPPSLFFIFFFLFLFTNFILLFEFKFEICFVL